MDVVPGKEDRLVAEELDPRRFPRRALHVEVCLRWAGNEAVTRSLSLSYSGALLRLPETIAAEGTRCEIEVRLPDGVVAGRGRIVRCRDGECAVDFDDLYRNGHLLIAALLE